jgi:hypothetical protein
MAELETDIVFKKNAGRRLGRVREKSDLGYEFFFTAEQLLLSQQPITLAKFTTETNRILA